MLSTTTKNKKHWVTKPFLLFLLLFMLLISKYACSYDFVIAGYVYYKNSFAPKANHQIYFTNDMQEIIETTYSDTLGNFFTAFNVPNDTSFTFYIYTSDYCNDSIPYLIDSVESYDSIYFKNIEVCYNNPNNCQASFFYDKLSETTIQFFNSSEGNVIFYSWNFGDGITSNEINPVHTYTDDGIYKVSLYIETIDSCTNSQSSFLSIEKQKYINGMVFAGPNLLPKGKIFSFFADTLDSNLIPTFNESRSIDSGYFSLPYSFYVPYIFYIIPELNIEPNHFPEYFPTYSGNTKFWKEAEKVYPGSFELYEISLVKQDSIYYGHASIQGLVNNYSINLMDFEDMCVLLLDMDFKPVKYTFFDIGFTFEFNKIPYGNYYILIDMIGVNATPYLVSVSKENPVKNVTFSIEENNITSIQNNLNEGKTVAYPNPFSSKITISLKNSYNNWIPINIYNYLGVLVYKTTIPNNSFTELNLETLKNGLYFIETPQQIFKVIKTP